MLCLIHLKQLLDLFEVEGGIGGWGGGGCAALWCGSVAGPVAVSFGVEN